MDFELADTVSVWVGNFSSQDELARYIQVVTTPDWNGDTPFSKFADDWGFISYDTDLQEAAFEVSPPTLEILINGVSYVESFSKQVCETAKNKISVLPNSFIMVFDFAYDPIGRFAQANTPVQFIGHFKYKKI